MSESPDHRAHLLSILASISFKLGDFTLASGAKSDFYIDCRTTTLHAEGGRLAGLVFLDLIRVHAPSAVAVGGLTMGADPLVSATSTASAWALAEHTEIAALSLQLDDSMSFDHDHDEPAPTLLHGFLVRKAEKSHGTGRLIEGFLQPGADVVIVDDVCTTGGSTLQALEAARSSGMNVVAVLCLVDREQGGRARIQAALPPGVPFVSLFTAADVRAAHIAQR